LECLTDFFDLAINDWLWLLFCGFCIGLAKTGLTGAGLLVVPIMASVFGAKPSTGILLPMLIVGDIFGVIYYHRHARLALLFKLFPSTILGIFVGVFAGDKLDAEQFKVLLAAIVLASVGIMIWKFRYKPEKSIPHNWWFATLAGSAGGFATMVGNAAGPLMSIYFLSMNLLKNNFIGTVAWFFLLVNVFKVPFHIFQWKTITAESVYLNLSMIPVILLGALAGIKIVKLIPEKPYRIFVLASITLAALKLFL